MKVSIIIPFHNEKSSLPRCLDSVLAQTHRSIEVLLVDGRSTDGSGEMADAYAARDPRIKVIHQDGKKGIAAGRNAGLAAASGRFVQFVDADDRIPPDMTEALVRAAVPDCDMVACGYRDVATDGTERRKNRLEVSGTIDAGEFAVRCVPMDMRWLTVVGAVWCKLYRMEIIRGNGLWFDGGIRSEDLLFSMQYFRHCRNVSAVPEAHYAYVSGDTPEEITSANKYYTDNVHSMLRVGGAFESAFSNRLSPADRKRCSAYFAGMLVATTIGLCRRDATIPRSEILERMAEVMGSPEARRWFGSYRAAAGQSRVVPFFLGRGWILPAFIAARLRADSRYQRYFDPATTRRGTALFS